MKIVQERYLVRVGQFPDGERWRAIHTDITAAIQTVQWPPGSGSFTLHDQSGKGRGEGSGVKPIKDACLQYLKSKGWSLNTPFPQLPAKRGPGAFDASILIGEQLFCFEWETGNISSSHRALNKMALGMLHKSLIGGVLVLPTRRMYKYLTDRVGNYSELEPYFTLWSSLPIGDGLLAAIAIEHDAVSKDVPRIPKGTDGRALL